jgi:uncharacterized protein YecE (DUF72 family)
MVLDRRSTTTYAALGRRVYTGETMASDTKTNVRAGTSGWAYPTWKGGFYPKDLGSKKFLNYYSTRLNSVEVNYTFSRPVTAQLLQAWIDATPPSFSFAAKAPQAITHFQRLRGARQQTRTFFESIKPLRTARKLGPVLFQLPPNFKCDLARLEGFLPVVPEKSRVAFEFRHPSWFAEEVYALLRRANVALCLAESDKLETPEVHTADFSYLRLRKGGYGDEARKQLTQKISGYARRGDVFVYFKHEDTPEGALHAEELLLSF